jgi:tripartite-type tricarboxylate transporter receptor subunit TctC
MLKMTAHLAGMALGLAVASSAYAQADDRFPSKTIRIVVPAAPGGVNDVLARLVAEKMRESFGQSVVIENKPGAATIVGAEAVARAEPDGYTLLSAPMATMAINPAVYTKLSYSPSKDFVPVSNMAAYPYVLSVNKNVPVRSVSELVEYTKANPAKANAGGASATFQLLTELLKQKTGAPIQFVPYRGANDAVIGLISGTLLLSFIDAGPAVPQIKGNEFRGLAVTSDTRLASLPDVPTLAEAGVPDMKVLSWSGFFAPAKTSPAIVKKLQDEIIRITKLPDIQERLRALELTPVGSTSEEFTRTIAQDTETWTAIAKAGNIRIEP